MWALLRTTLAQWQFRQASLLASSLAYYTVFSLAPLLVIVIGVVGVLFGQAGAEGRVVEQLQHFVGRDGAQVIETAIVNMRESTNSRNPVGVLFSITFLIVGSSNLFFQIRRALNQVWNIVPTPKHGFLYFFRKLFLSFAMVLMIAFLLLVSFILSAVLGYFVDALSAINSDLIYLWKVVNFLVSFSVTTLLIALIYRVLPDVRVAWQAAGVGGAITALLFSIGQFLFGQFLGHISLGSAYGVAGSLVIVIVWIYYAAHLLLLGAEFTQVYAERRGTPIVPSEQAVRVPQMAIASPSLQEK
ncbi:YihY/virulence factor BrkB family protein [Oculatella sp. LEGE 06141]|nr:YihY/virulence factor BrkB family protein [Oculatella sp. LEGE 06141]MBE9177219.1 YihY/virulence factor BrkB family protein [Oculatella sp. LEGE 06141]